MRKIISIIFVCATAFLTAGVAGAEQNVFNQSGIVGEVYPNLASGALTFAKTGQLPEGVLLKAENVEVKLEDVNKAIEAQPVQIREELRRSAFFVLEQEAAGRLLLQSAKKTAENPGNKTDEQLLNDYINRLTEKVTITDQEIQTFYRENEGVFCGTPLEKVKNQIGPYVLDEKKQRLVAEHIRTLGKRIDIIVSAPWVEGQVVLAKNNPLDKIRGNGKTTLAIFSAASCCGPDKMLPVFDALKSQYTGSLNILYLEAKKEQILAARHNVYSIPTQLIFDKTGKETFRHTGFLSKDEIAKKLAEMGVK